MLLTLCNRAEEYDHAGSSECDSRAQASAVGQGKLTRAKPPPRRTKATLIYRRTGNLRAVQLLLGACESTVRYPGIEVDDALAIAEQVDV